MRRAPAIVVSEEDRVTLERWSRGRRTPVRQSLRAQIVLLAAAGVENQEIASQLGTTRPTVGLWRRRFAESGISGIRQDAPRGGRPPKQRQDLVAEIVRKTTQETPRNATHWTTRSLARELGTNQALVHRVWRTHGLKPHLSRTFKVSTDPRFEEKLLDVVGLYLRLFRNPGGWRSLRACETLTCTHRLGG